MIIFYTILLILLVLAPTVFLIRRHRLKRSEKEIPEGSIKGSPSDLRRLVNQAAKYPEFDIPQMAFPSMSDVQAARETFWKEKKKIAIRAAGEKNYKIRQQIFKNLARMSFKYIVV